MNKQLIQQLPKLKNLPRTMPKESAVRLELEQGVVIFALQKKSNSGLKICSKKTKPLL